MGAIFVLIGFILLLCLLTAVFEGTKPGRKVFSWFCRKCFGIYI